MDEIQKQEKKRFFHARPVLVPVSDCYDFIMYPNGLMSAFKGHRSAGNEKIILYFLTRHMSQETSEGETTEFKDIAQSFWGRHDYIVEKTGLSKSRISEALKSLVDGGVLLHYVEPGVGQRIAFSSEVISHWCDFSHDQAFHRLQRSSGKRNNLVPVSGTSQFRSPEQVSSGKRNNLVPVSGTAPFIEEKGIGFSGRDSENSPSGWMEEQKPGQEASQPAKRSKKLVRLVGQSKRLEAAFKPKGYVDYDETNLFLAGLLDRYGEAVVGKFVDWTVTNAGGFRWRRDAGWGDCLAYCWEQYVERFENLGANEET